jgi:hypothetical protein
LIVRIAERFGKLPSEVLKEDNEWLQLIITVMEADNERTKLEARRAKSNAT